MIKCEVHKDCPDEVVAQVNLPGPHGTWVCERGFNEWQEQKEKEKND